MNISHSLRLRNEATLIVSQATMLPAAYAQALRQIAYRIDEIADEIEHEATKPRVVGRARRWLRVAGGRL
jgi:hypothetical protein